MDEKLDRKKDHCFDIEDTTPKQRRRRIVELLATALIRMSRKREDAAVQTRPDSNLAGKQGA